MMTRRRAAAIWLVLGLAALAVLVAALGSGSVSLGPRAVWLGLSGEGPGGAIVQSLRLPRALAGFACGALLALAGALLQVLLRNPLADPYVLGVSGGAAALALIAMLCALPWWGVQAAAFGGALVSMALVLGLARARLSRAEMRSGSDEPSRLLLTGVVIATGWGALLTLLLTIASGDLLRGMVFWLAGDLNGATRAAPAGIALLLAMAVSIPLAPRLNVLLRGDETAAALGVAVGPLRLRIYLVASLATAAAVTTAGTIGFIGLIAPHAIRLAFGNDQRMLLPASALLGGATLMAADLVSRTIVAPVQLPVGVVTALVGVPVFLWLLLRRRR